VDGAIKLTKLAEHSQDINKFTMTEASKVDDDFVLMLCSSDIKSFTNKFRSFKKV
jgi:hypothetical protein